MLLVLLCTAPCVARLLSRADPPEVKLGESWVYQDRDVRTGEKRDTSFLVTMVDTDKIVAETGLSTSGAWTFTRDWNPVERKTGETVADSMKPPWPYLQFPLEVGKSWDMAFENEVKTQSGKRNAKWQWEARVVSTEAVTVPAGTFQTLRIEYDGTFASTQGSRSWTGSRKETMWYAPQAKRLVKREFEQSVPANNSLEHHVIELISFKLAK
jgi:hypothetical protein